MRRQLSKSDVVELNSTLHSLFGREFFGKKDIVVIIEKDGIKFVVCNNVPVFFYKGDILVPLLRFLLSDCFLKKVSVDAGAVKFVCSGADVMRPGIVDIDDSILEGSLVAVVDSTHKKPLAVCVALFSGSVMRSMERGKVLRSLHFVGDPMWNVVL